MSPEITVFVYTIILAFVHIMLESTVKTLHYGMGPSLGPRDDLPPPTSAMVGRAIRTKNNMLETLPLALGLLIVVQLTGVGNEMTAMGAWLYLIARVVYIPMYLLGIPWLRTLAWGASVVGLVMLLLPLLG